LVSPIIKKRKLKTATSTTVFRVDTLRNL